MRPTSAYQDTLHSGEVEDRQNDERRQCDVERHPGEFLGVEDRNDENCAEVIDDRECSQKELQRGGYPIAEQSHDPKGESDVGCRRDRPTCGCAGRGRGRPWIDQSRDDHAADGGRAGQDRPLSIRQLALDNLAFDFEPDQKKKDRHQPVVDPQQQRLFDAEIADPQRGVHAQQQVVNPSKRRVGEDESKR
jgi:hypothetical protein